MLIHWILVGLAWMSSSIPAQVGREELVEELRAAGFAVEHSRGVFVGVRQFLEPDGRPSDKIVPVPFAVDDAVDLAYTFVYEVPLIEPGGVVLLLSGDTIKAISTERLDRLRAEGAVVEQPTRSNVLENVKRARTSTDADGLFVLQFASHGFTDAGVDMLLGADAVRSDLRRTALRVGGLLDEVAQAKAERRLVILDACRERVSTSRGLGDEGLVMRQSFAQALMQATGMVVLSGTVAGGYSYDDSELGNGVFTAKLLEGMLGAAPGDRHGFITLETLAHWADAEVREWVQLNVEDEKAVSKSHGITFNVEDLRSASFPLAVNPDDFRAAGELRERVAAASERLQGVVDFVILRGDHAQEIFEALESADEEQAEQLFKRIGYLTRADPRSTERFVEWWLADGRESFGVGAQPATGAGRGVALASYTIPYGMTRIHNADQEPNGSLSTAAVIEPSSSLSGQVDGAADEQDRYHLRPRQNGLLTIKVRNLEPAGTQNAGLGFVILEDAQAHTLGSIHPANLVPGGENGLGPVPVSADHSYYVVLQPAGASHVSRYEFESSFTPLSQMDSWEPNDTLGEAQQIDVGGGSSGLVGFGEDEQDWFRFRPTDHGVCTLHVSNEYAEVQVLLGGMGHLLAKDSAGKDLTSIHSSLLSPSAGSLTSPFPVQAGANYFAVVQSGPGQQAAPYRIDVIVEPLLFSDAKEPNDSRGQSATVDVGETVKALIGFDGDLVDWYRVVPENDGNLRVMVHNQHVDGSTVGAGIGGVFVLADDGSAAGAIHPSLLGPSKSASSEPFRVFGGREYYVRVDRSNHQLGGAPYLLEISP